MYFTSTLVTQLQVHLIFETLFKGCFGNKTLLFQQRTSDKFSTDEVLPDHAIKTFWKEPILVKFWSPRHCLY